MSPSSWSLLADAVLVLHTGVVVFVIGGLLAILLGNRWHWAWVNRRGFRWLHLATLGVVVVQAWLGQHCPLTILESWLRLRAGGLAYQRSFIADWLQRLIYWEAPLWVFAIAYTAFAGLVLLAWWRWPPGTRRA